MLWGFLRSEKIQNWQTKSEVCSSQNPEGPERFGRLKSEGCFFFSLGLLQEQNMEDIADWFWGFFNGRKDEFCAATFPNVIIHYSLQIYYSLGPDSICLSKKRVFNIWPLQISSLSSLSHSLKKKIKKKKASGTWPNLRETLFFQTWDWNSIFSTWKNRINWEK